MTQEEKAKAYDEALKVLHKYDGANIMFSQSLKEEMFPELKEEPEDERIRKVLIKAFEDMCWETWRGIKREKILNWLEKQGKNNMGISEATKQKLEDNLNKALEKETPESWNEFLEKQGEQKPANKVEPDILIEESYQQQADDLIDMVTEKPAWSEEDEEKLDRLYHLLRSGADTSQKIREEWANWLKTLKNRYTWKPSDLPHWKKSNLQNDNTTGFNSDYFCHNWYSINYKELFEKLPKDD